MSVETSTANEMSFKSSAAREKFLAGKILFNKWILIVLKCDAPAASLALRKSLTSEQKKIEEMVACEAYTAKVHLRLLIKQDILIE